MNAYGLRRRLARLEKLSEAELDAWVRSLTDEELDRACEIDRLQDEHPALTGAETVHYVYTGELPARYRGEPEPDRC